MKVFPLLLALSLATASFGQPSAPERTVTKLSDGVYVMRHQAAPTGFPQSNTTVVIGDREVLVVDSCYLQSTARGDIAQIKEWTNKPVRYLVNTHWHNDHVMGNRAYAEAFPGLAVIAHVETKKDMDLLIPLAPTRTADALKTMNERLASGKDANGNALTDEQKAQSRDAIKRREAVVADYNSFVYQAPTLSFDSAIDLDLGNRAVQIRYLGKGNTTGDAIVYLPKEKILVTGDLLVYPLPFTLDGYPTQWIQTLDKLGQMEAVAIVPGHGPVQNDKTYLNNLRDLFQAAVEQVDKQLYTVGPAEVHTVEEVRPGVDLSSFRKRFAGDDETLGRRFDATVESIVNLVFKEASLR